MKTEHPAQNIFLAKALNCVRPALEIEAIKEEQRGVVSFLVAEGVGICKIHRRMSAVYGEDCTVLQ